MNHTPWLTKDGSQIFKGVKGGMYRIDSKGVKRYDVSVSQLNNGKTLSLENKGIINGIAKFLKDMR